MPGEGLQDFNEGHGEASETERRWVEDLIQPGGADPLDLPRTAYQPGDHFPNATEQAQLGSAATREMLEALKEEARAGEDAAVDAAAEKLAEGVDLMRESVGMFQGDLWQPTGRMANEWASTGGARARLSWVSGEVCATFLPKGWEGMATYQRALVAERVRVRATGDLVELGFAAVEYGGLGGRAKPDSWTHGGALSERAGVAGAVGPMPGAPVEPGSTELKVQARAVALPSGQVDSGMLPSRAHGNDAGLDLYTVGVHRIPHGSWYDLPVGIAIEIPDHCWGMVIGRSSAMKRRGLHVQISVIDPGYRGPLFVQAMNVRPNKDDMGMIIPDEELVAVIGDKERIGQLILVPNVTPMFTPVWSAELGESERGSSGFGDSGR